MLGSLFSYSQTDAEQGRIGFAINSGINGELYPIRVIPSVTYLKNKSQYEIGFGIHPYFRKDQDIYSGEFNYKFFPNGTDDKFNMYLVGNISYVHNRRETFFPTNYNYLFLNGGYGFQLVPFKNGYMGTNISIGLFTNNKKSEIPYAAFAEKSLFEDFGFNMAFQFNIGYRL